jgi:hypothetical protein
MDMTERIRAFSSAGPHAVAGASARAAQLGLSVIAGEPCVLVVFGYREGKVG